MSFLIIFIHQFHLGVDNSAHTFHSTFEDKGVECLGLIVKRHSEVEATLECNLVGGADAHAEDYTYGSLLGLGIIFVVLIILTVEVNSAMYVIEHYRRHLYSHLSACQYIEESPTEVVAILFVIEIAALHFECEQAFGYFQIDFSLIALVGAAGVTTAAIGR